MENLSYQHQIQSMLNRLTQSGHSSYRYVCENSTRWDANFKNAAMALSNVGDVTETPAIGSSGIHIIRYESDVAAGPVDLESVRDALYEETLNNAKSTHLSEAINSWVEALNPVYHLDAFK